MTLLNKLYLWSLRKSLLVDAIHILFFYCWNWKIRISTEKRLITKTAWVAAGWYGRLFVTNSGCFLRLFSPTAMASMALQLVSKSSYASAWCHGLASSVCPLPTPAFAASWFVFLRGRLNAFSKVLNNINIKNNGTKSKNSKNKYESVDHLSENATINKE